MDRAARAQLLKGREVRRGLLVSNHVEVRSAGNEIRFHGLASSTSLRDGKLGDDTSTLTRDNGYDMGWYTERIMAGSCAKTLSEKPDVQFLINHEGLPLSRTTNGTLDLRETDDGLEYDATTDGNDPEAQRVKSKVESGLMDQCSFAFRVTRQNWSEDYDVREITELDLNRGDVSIVNYGANAATSVVMRSMFANLAELGVDEIEELRADANVMGAVRQLIAIPSIDSFTEALREIRAGASFSAVSEATVKQVLTLCATSDEARNTAQKVLTDLLGVTTIVAGDVEAESLSLDLAKAKAFALRQHSRRIA